MSEEKKEEKLEAPAPQAGQTQAQASVEAKASSVETPQVQTTPAQDKPKEEKKVEPVKKEKPSNCAACNKSIRKKRWYYRNGKFYCTKRCWTTTLKKEEAPKAAAA